MPIQIEKKEISIQSERWQQKQTIPWTEMQTLYTFSVHILDRLPRNNDVPQSDQKIKR